MNKPTAILMAVACFLGGIILGYIFAPSKHGIVIGCNNEVEPSGRGILIGCNNKQTETVGKN